MTKGVREQTPSGCSRTTRAGSDCGSLVRTGRRGFTIIEMVVVIALLAIAVSAVVISISNSRRANLKSSAGKMASMARYLYNRAIIDARPYRLVIDLDEGAFWGEAMVSDDSCARYIPSPDAEERDEERQRQEKKRERQEQGQSEAETEAQDVMDQASGFSLMRDQLLKPRKIPPQVRVSGLMTAHHDERQREGRGAIHFWPDGSAERALVWYGERSSDDDAIDGWLTVLTLEVEALTGRVKRHNEELNEQFLKQENTL